MAVTIDDGWRIHFQFAMTFASLPMIGSEILIRPLIGVDRLGIYHSLSGRARQRIEFLLVVRS